MYYQCPHSCCGRYFFKVTARESYDCAGCNWVQPLFYFLTGAFSSCGIVEKRSIHSFHLLLFGSTTKVHKHKNHKHHMNICFFTVLLLSQNVVLKTCSKEDYWQSDGYDCSSRCRPVMIWGYRERIYCMKTKPYATHISVGVQTSDTRR
jgi:hypothetical protein